MSYVLKILSVECKNAGADVAGQDDPYLKLNNGAGTVTKPWSDEMDSGDFVGFAKGERPTVEFDNLATVSLYDADPSMWGLNSDDYINGFTVQGSSLNGASASNPFVTTATLIGGGSEYTVTYGAWAVAGDSL